MDVLFHSGAACGVCGPVASQSSRSGRRLTDDIFPVASLSHSGGSHRLIGHEAAGARPMAAAHDHSSPLIRSSCARPLPGQRSCGSKFNYDTLGETPKPTLPCLPEERRAAEGRSQTGRVCICPSRFPDCAHSPDYGGSEGDDVKHLRRCILRLVCTRP